MKVLLIGATGTIGQKVAQRLADAYEVIAVGFKDGDFQVDIADKGSITSLFEQVGAVDALISTTGLAEFGPLDALIAVVGGDSMFKGYRDLADEDFRFGFEHKFLGQVRLVKIGEKFARDKGSFTLSSGFLSHYPNEASIATGLLNAAVDTFVRMSRL